MPLSPEIACYSNTLQNDLLDLFLFSRYSLSEIALDSNNTLDDSPAKNGTIMSSTSLDILSKPYSEQGFNSILDTSPLLPPRLIEPDPKASNKISAVSTDNSHYITSYKDSRSRQSILSLPPSTSF